MVDGEGEGGGPPRLERVTQAPPPASRGLAAPEVTASAAIAAGLPYQGNLADDGPLRLCYLAAAAQASGRLELEGERGRFTLHFKRGAVEHASSDTAEDDLGRFLVSRGAVTREALADAERVRGDLGGDLVTVLTSLHLLNPAESFHVLQEHGLAVLARALGVEKGSCRWTPGAPLPPSSFPLGSRWGGLCGAARRLDGLAVRKLLGDRAQRVASRAGGRVQLADLKLTAHEARAAALFDGKSTPGQLAVARPSEADTILRAALLLGEMELLAFGPALAAPATTPPPDATPPAPPQAATTPTQDPASTPAPAAAAGAVVGHAPAPRPAAPARPERGQASPATSAASPAAPAATPAHGTAGAAPRPPPPAPRAPSGGNGAAAARPQEPKAQGASAARPAVPQDVGVLTALYEKLRGADHFAALGVKQDATAQQIKLAYFQLAKSYHPDAGPPGEPSEVKKLRADVFARLGEAWAVLGEDAKRAEYVRELASGGAAEVDVSAIFKAEELFQKATILVKTRQYDKALETLGEAIKLNGEEPEFQVWRAWVQFLVAQDRKRQQEASAAVIEAALRKVPRCMPGYLFLAQMAKISGDLKLAERHLRRGLALDPEHAELGRELKHLKK